MIWQDKYGRDHGELTGMVMIQNIVNQRYIANADKLHIYETPLRHKAYIFLTVEKAEAFIDAHLVGYQYKIVS